MSLVQSKKLILGALGALVAAVPSVGLASGFDRGVVPPDFLYEKDDIVQVSLAVVKPDVRGKIVASPKATLEAQASFLQGQAAANPGNLALQQQAAQVTYLASKAPAVGQETGNLPGDYERKGISLKKTINDDFTIGLQVTQPAGLDIAYPDEIFGVYVETEITSLDLLLKYQVNDVFSVFGGPRIQQNSSGGFANDLNGEFHYQGTTEVGYMVGAGYKNPDLHTQVLVSYTSDIKHTMDATPISGSGPVADGVIATDYEGEVYINTPDHFQVAIKQPLSDKSALIASYRKSGWSQANIETNLAGFESLTDFKDVEAYTLGYGRKLTEEVALFATLLHQTGEANVFGPVNNRTGAALIAQFKVDRFKVETGVTYFDLEDAETTIPMGAAGDVVTKFEGNSALAYTFRLGYYF
ncbi:OmpP1/FadL family transporter [Shewanella woodyi]|uniref:OmpP1/FadL family transporter n=1 Tax=Shewanella woodyi TaxID=60961 RepID=UPI000319239D|nr:outer membrane protein transport protein [Shewanella woodyi]